MLRGEVLARWQEFVGTGELTRNLEERIGRLVDRVGAFLTGRQQPTDAVEEALESSLEALVRAAAEGAAERAVDAWRVRPAGRALLTDRARTLGHVSPEFRPALEREVRAWQAGILELVADQGRERRTAARLATFGTNGAGLVLMLAVFAHTGGLTGTEVLVAGGTTAASHKVLEAVFGDSAVRALAATARADLLERVESAAGAGAGAVRGPGGDVLALGRCGRRGACGPGRLRGGAARLAHADASGHAGRRGLPVTLLAARPSGLADRLAALDEILDLADGRLEPATVAQARAVAAKAGERLRLGMRTPWWPLRERPAAGSPPSPTSSPASRCHRSGCAGPPPVSRTPWSGAADAGPLLDWLEVPRRHVLRRPPDLPEAGFDGLVLLDLPDVDSVERRHRLEADRLVERVDLLVWVLDPQKYADGVIHDRYLAPLAGHADVCSSSSTRSTA